MKKTLTMFMVLSFPWNWRTLLLFEAVHIVGSSSSSSSYMIDIMYLPSSTSILITSIIDNITTLTVIFDVLELQVLISYYIYKYHIIWHLLVIGFRRSRRKKKEWWKKKEHLEQIHPSIQVDTRWVQPRHKLKH